ncbi:uncharacterized protein EDB93DRAFT_1247624 [Suillus bovinus]|uniref:uncharacterized protein n=1 Tax=Suillus bovinus TaxID=48563 RepID=UPI001B87519E|nr:uncharacterized protein EDB93DRAFT_1247624 [Suillus bovinus]KAG2155979.1 hypothetical protein EDB93DRAFT_1247624 [Suillus bovinus]
MSYTSFNAQMYKTWLFNNKKKKERKDMIKYGRKWMPRMVIYQENQEEVLKRIEDESGAKPGDPGMFKHYQAAVKRVMAELSDDELEKAKETVEEWSNNCPPSKIQAQVACKKGPAYMEHFLKEMWRQCGMRVFVLSAWKNEQGEVLFGMHDDNEALGDGDSFMKTKDWEDIEPGVAGVCAGTVPGAREGGRQMKGGRKRIRKPAFELDTDEDGMPLLPDITETKLEEKKAIVRAFLTLHYQDLFGDRQGTDVDLKEPSKLQNWDMTALLNFWYARQEKGEGSTFMFKAWKNKDGDMVASGRIRQVAFPSDRVKSKTRKGDFGNDTHYTDDDDDDDDNDSADGRSPKKRTRTREGPSSSHAETAIPLSIPKPRPVKLAKRGALLTSRMGNLLAGLTNSNTGDVDDDVAMEGRKTSPAPKRMQGKTAVIEPSARTTRSKSTPKPLDSTPQVTRARGRK